MKPLSLLLFTGLLSVTLRSAAQSGQEHLITARLSVAGVCDMCRERIENAGAGRGVRALSWNSSSKILTVTFDPKRSSLQQVARRIRLAGHDNGQEKAEAAVYGKLPACCRYRSFGSMEEMERLRALAPQEADSAGMVSGFVLGLAPASGSHPLEGATVAWLHGSGSTLTDARGRFSLPLAGGGRKIVISHAGFRSDTVETATLEQAIILTAGTQLQEVRVTAPSRLATYVPFLEPIRSVTMLRRELQKAACCNLSESFETNPSVDVSFNDAVTGSKQIQLLGLSGNYTQLTVENLPGPRGLATPLGLSSIPGTWIESIQLVKGTGSVANGFESIAGQINVELRKPGTERLFANVYVNDFGKTDLNLNFTQKAGKRWATTLLLHDAFLNNRHIDFNKDGFRDLPTGNLFTAVNRWSFDNQNGLTAHVGLRWLDDRKVGGQVDFDPRRDKGTTNAYGLEMNISRREVFSKIGYVLPGAGNRSIGLQLSAFDHRQDAWFGLTNYGGRQQNIYGNLLYQSDLGSRRHRFRTGLSFLLDRYNEQFRGQQFGRRESVPGGFVEYTFSPTRKFDLVAGLRQDHNSLYGWFTTPRLHLRYAAAKNTVLRAGIGRGQRTANVLAENNSVFVSARQLRIEGGSGGAYGLQAEVAWNKGISLDQKLRLFGRNATLSAEYFRTDFRQQVVTDLEDPALVRVYNLQGRSFASGLQAELNAEPVRNLQLRIAWRYFDVRTTYGDRLLEKPFTARHRGFLNLAYEAKGWKFDYTVSVTGRKRLPATGSNPEAYKRESWSPVFALMNGQLSKALGKHKNIDLYIGGENLGNFFQSRLITAADQPFGPHFDAALIWGPVNGRMFYGGFRFALRNDPAVKKSL